MSNLDKILNKHFKKTTIIFVPSFILLSTIFSIILFDMTDRAFESQEKNKLLTQENKTLTYNYEDLKKDNKYKSMLVIRQNDIIDRFQSSRNAKLKDSLTMYYQFKISE